MYKSIHFILRETGCRCGKCDMKQGMSDHTKMRADLLREMCEFPLYMTSGYRCPLHLDNPNGPHGTGNAFDINISNLRAYQVLKHAILLNFRGIGISQKGENRFLHLDDCENIATRPRPRIWSY